MKTSVVIVVAYLAIGAAFAVNMGIKNKSGNLSLKGYILMLLAWPFTIIAGRGLAGK